MEASPKQQDPSAAGHGFGERMLMAQPDSVLCKLAARGNASAYEVLYERYRQPVFAFVFHLLGRREGTHDCEDILQDTFAKAFAGIREKRVEGSFRAWIYTIARNGTYDLIRARKSNVHSLDAATTEPPAAAEHTETDKHAEQRLELSWLVAAMSDLPERQRDALLMRELGGLSHTQIAGELGTTVSATKKLIGRGREAVTEAATVDGYRPRKLSRDLALAAPVVPFAAIGLGLSAAGGAAFASGGAAAGGAAFGGKTAAAVLTVMALGGGAAIVEHERATGSEAPASFVMAAGPAAANAAAGENEDSGAESNRGGGLPLFGQIDDDRERRNSRAEREDPDDGTEGRRGGDDDFEGSSDDGPRPDRREVREDRERSADSGPGGGGGGDEPREPRPEDTSDHSGPGGGGDEPRPDDSGNSGPGGDELPE